MKCSILGCPEPARYRTLGEALIAFVCLMHMELALDSQWPQDKLISLPKVAS